IGGYGVPAGQDEELHFQRRVLRFDDALIHGIASIRTCRSLRQVFFHLLGDPLLFTAARVWR
ncbi:hypothetical protein, partial [Stenotrophomonas maltophilia]|uniref:hypothetical protein n=1 Tax=Stenotrophomonas maltophilia TaxID=40324 RepID=UPI0031456791